MYNLNDKLFLEYLVLDLLQGCHILEVKYSSNLILPYFFSKYFKTCLNVYFILNF